jgi:hypothetical protein
MRETKPRDSLSIFVVFRFGNPSREENCGNNETSVSCKNELRVSGISTLPCISNTPL